MGQSPKGLLCHCGRRQSQGGFPPASLELVRCLDRHILVSSLQSRLCCEGLRNVLQVPSLSAQAVQQHTVDWVA